MAPHPPRWVTATLAVTLAVLAIDRTAVADSPDAIKPDAQSVLFVLGEEDGRRAGYQIFGWIEIDEHACTMGVDCHKKPFPSHLHAASENAMWRGSAVERIIVTFNLGVALESSTLRLVRAGAETISVRMDDGPEVLVTKSMMQPETYEHSGFGSFNLELGALKTGIHVLQLAVAEDGEGNGRFGWDAIILRTSED